MRKVLEPFRIHPGSSGVGRTIELKEIEAIYRKPRTSQPTAQQKIYLYPLRERPVEAADDVWCAYVTCIPMGLVAGRKTFRGLNWAQRPLWAVGGTIPSF
jgi:hypothetical protein